MDLSAHSIHYFLEKHQIRTSNGVPFDFKDRPFMWDIFNDFSPRQTVLKAPQVGMSELSIVKIFWVAKYKHRDLIYTLPTSSDVTDFAGGKINRIIAQNPVFSEWVDDKDSVEQKAIGNNRIYFRGTFTTRAAMMVSSQLNVHDEIDASNQEVITQYETRQQAQAGGWKWTFSHPSVVGNGVDKEWQLSNKREWFITCPHCKDEHYMTFPESIDKQRECYICKACKQPIDDNVRRKGVWKATSEGEVSGYHISQLMCPWITAKKILKDFKEKDAQYFANFVLALPYADPTNQVSLDVINKSILPKTIREGRVIIGIDTGIAIRYVIGDKRGLFAYGEVSNYNDLRRIVKRYKDPIIVMDALGDIIGSREFYEEYYGRCFLCYYQNDRQTMQMIKWGEGEEFGKVSIERNRVIQLLVDEYNTDLVTLVGTPEYWHNYYLHWASMYRLTEFDNRGNKIVKWERNGRNDWVMAHVYQRIGADKFQEQESTFVGGEAIPWIDDIPDVPVAELRNGVTFI